jgi:hypothetical protein
MVYAVYKLAVLRRVDRRPVRPAGSLTISHLRKKEAIMPARTARSTSTASASKQKGVFIATDIAGDSSQYSNWKATDWVDTLRYLRDEKNAVVRFIHSRKVGILQTVTFPEITDSDGFEYTFSVVPYTGRIQSHYRNPETGERRVVSDEIEDPESGKILSINNVGINPEGKLRHIPRTWEEVNASPNGEDRQAASGKTPDIF